MAGRMQSNRNARASLKKFNRINYLRISSRKIQQLLYGIQYTVLLFTLPFL